LLTATPLLSASAAQKAPRWFEVEVILFTRNVTAASVNEHWPAQQSILDFEHAPDLLSPRLFGKKTSSQPDDCDVAPSSEEPTSNLTEAQAEAIEPPLPCPSVPYKITAKPNVPKIVVASRLPDYDTAPYLIDAASLQLEEQRNIIQRRPEFNLMLHTGWRQAMVPRRNSPQWHLFAGKDFVEQFTADGKLRKAPAIEAEAMSTPAVVKEPLTTEQVQANITKLLNEQERISVTEPTTTQSKTFTGAQVPESPLWQLEGLFRVYLEHYLYIDADFNYHVVGKKALPQSEPTTQSADIKPLAAVAPLLTDEKPVSATEELNVEVLPVSEPDNSNTGGTLVDEGATEPFLYHYRLSQSRRLRSGEIHYFDHPLMGIIVQIRTHDYRRPPEIVAPESIAPQTESVTQQNTTSKMQTETLP
jgi:hypothetical protein